MHCNGITWQAWTVRSAFQRKLVKVLNFKNEAVDLCLLISNIVFKKAAQKLYGLDVNKHCKFISMNMNPLFKPSGVGNVLRRTLSKRKVNCIATDIKQLGGNL